MRRHLPQLLLVLALLSGQAFLAYHGPSHITGEADVSTSGQLAQDDCQLGGQAHSPALPGTLVVAPQPAAGPVWLPPASHIRTFNRALRPLARAPPLSA